MAKRNQAPFGIGDKVAYSVQFLRSVGLSHSEAARARGVVKALTMLGPGRDATVLAEIEWDRDMPERVNVANLARVGLNTRFSNC